MWGKSFFRFFLSADEIYLFIFVPNVPTLSTPSVHTRKQSLFCLHFHLNSSKTKIFHRKLLFKGKTLSLSTPPAPILSIFDRIIYCVTPPWNKSRRKHIGMMYKLIKKYKIVSFPCFNNFRSHYSSRAKEKHASSLILEMHSRSRDLWFMFAVMQWRT